MRACGTTEKGALPLGVTTVNWCWDDGGTGTGDAETETWAPQGITTSGDADGDGAWGEKRAILSGWHYKVPGGTAADDPYNEGDGRYNDARVAFIDYTDPAHPAYRWVYLVVPQAGGATFSAAEAHIGGMVWYADKLFVTAVGNRSTAIRVFSMQHILQTTSAAATIGKTGGAYAAYGYQYVMPQVGYYTYAGGACDGNSDTGVPCFSSISLDRFTSPDSLVTTEYHAYDAGLGTQRRGRLYRYDLTGAPDYLLRKDSSDRVTVTEAYRTDVTNMQGVLSFKDKWYVPRSSRTAHSQLWKLTTTGSAPFSCSASAAHACWAFHPEALTYNYATSRVWSQSEWTVHECATEVAGSPQNCGRAVFSLPLSALP
jgi:hypothetical protein